MYTLGTMTIAHEDMQQTAETLAKIEQAVLEELSETWNSPGFAGLYKGDDVVVRRTGSQEYQVFQLEEFENGHARLSRRRPDGQYDVKPAVPRDLLYAWNNPVKTLAGWQQVEKGFLGAGEIRRMAHTILPGNPLMSPEAALIAARRATSSSAPVPIEREKVYAVFRRNMQRLDPQHT